MKSFGLIASPEENSKKQSIDCGMWLSVLILMRIYNKKESTEQKKLKMYNQRRKGAPGSGMQRSPVFKEINRPKKSLVLNGIRRVVILGEDPTQLSFQPVRRN